MDKINQLVVLYNDRHVGTMAMYKNGRAAFEYSREWINDGFSINPFSLPLERRVFIPGIEPFEGLYGVFADSLPDGWGHLLVDRLLLKKNMSPFEIDSMQRLAIVGASGMGAPRAVRGQKYWRAGISIFSVRQRMWHSNARNKTLAIHVKERLFSGQCSL